MSEEQDFHNFRSSILRCTLFKPKIFVKIALVVKLRFYKIKQT